MAGIRTDFRFGFQASQRIVDIAADRTLTSADSGKMFVAGAVDLTVTLPAPKDGLRYDIFVETLSTVTGLAITATSTLIVGNGSAGATTLTNTAATDVVGDMVSLESDGTSWFVTNIDGTWANT